MNLKELSCLPFLFAVMRQKGTITLVKVILDLILPPRAILTTQLIKFNPLMSKMSLLSRQRSFFILSSLFEQIARHEHGGYHPSFQRSLSSRGKIPNFFRPQFPHLPWGRTGLFADEVTNVKYSVNYSAIQDVKYNDFQAWKAELLPFSLGRNRKHQEG